MQASLVRALESALPTLLVAGVLCLITFLAGGGLNLSTRTPVEIALTLACGIGIAAAILLAPAGRRAYRSVVGGSAARTRRALGAVGDLVGAARRQLAGRRAPVRLQRRVRARRAARARCPRALVGGARGGAARRGDRVRLCAAQQDLPRRDRRRSEQWACLRPAASAVRLLERDRPRGRDRRDRMYVARRPPRRARAAERTRLPSDGADAGDAAARLLARRTRGAGARAGAVAVPRPVAPARGGRALQRRARGARGGRVGLLPTRAHHRRHPACRTGHRRAPARGAARRGAYRAHARRSRDRLRLRPPGALAADAQTCGHGATRASRDRRDRPRRTAHRQPPRPVRQHLAHRQHAHQPQRPGTRQRPWAAHRDRQRARALLERSAGDLHRPSLLGVGAEGYETARLRYRTAILNVGQAHGFIVQTLADLGLAGLLVVLALLGAWMCAAGRATHPFNRRWRRWRWLRAHGRRAPLLRRAGRAAHAGLRRGDVRHPFVRGLDLVRPRVACAALLCAGWLAGRGPLRACGGHRRPGGPRPEPGGADCAAVALAHIARRRPAARGDRRRRRLLVRCSRRGRSGSRSARSTPQTKRSRWWRATRPPRSPPRTPRSAATRSPPKRCSRSPPSRKARPIGRGERATYEHAVRLQPSNFHTWQALGEYDLRVGQPQAALQALRATVYLNPEAVAPRVEHRRQRRTLSIQNAYLQALRDTAGRRRRCRHAIPDRALDEAAHGRRALAFRPQSKPPTPRRHQQHCRGGSGPTTPTAVSICSKPKSSSSPTNVRRV